ncbi:hypothetical protein ABZW44_49370 [Streptomyces mirabilis]|uniref:hypothetical protein n=1 Tax=Streptomyces mirabilis TaxID=68239 RepID=UPI0033A3EC73
MTLLLIVALGFGAVGVYIAYKNPKLGAAILVGLGIITVLYLIWGKDPTLPFQVPTPTVAPSGPWAGPSRSPLPSTALGEYPNGN